jgi:UDP-3-O-[3-hydroxymyristoyl] glucosamine N-acyltransferase
LKPSSNNPDYSLAELAAMVGGVVEGDSQVRIRSAAPIETAGPDQICFVANSKYLHFLNTTTSGAVVLAPDVPFSRTPVLRHQSPYFAFATIVDLLYPDQPLLATGIDATSVVHPEAHIDSSAAIGPLCHISRGAEVGPGCQLVSSVFLGENVRLGNNCLLYPGVKIMKGCRLGDRVILHSGVVVGSDGFGFAESPSGLKKIRQVGWVEIGDDVEIGSNTTIDRGALGPTRIGRGTKIDNLVQIGHNVEVGQHCIVVSQVGISGSTKIGNGVILAGQVGLVGHIEVGDGVRVGAQSGVAKSIPPGNTMFGSPAREAKESMRIEAALVRLPDLLKRVRKLEKKLGDDSAD